MKTVLSVLFCIVIYSACTSSENDIKIIAKPGGTYYLPEKIENTHIYVSGNGSKEEPFKIIGDSNSTTISGNSFIKIQDNSSFITIENLKFINNKIKEKESTALIEIGKTGKENISNIKVSNVEIKYDTVFIDQDVETQFFWVKVSANDVLISECKFEGKQNRLPIIHVDAKFQNVVIENSTFSNVKPRIGEALEAIRVGLQDGKSNTIIKNNLFFNYHGDSETISCKASGMKIHDNIFQDSRSGVCIRFSDNCLVLNNKFINTVNPVRVAGSDNRIVGNIFKGSINSVVLMVGGKEDSKYGFTYPPVRDLLVKNNTFYNNENIIIIRHANDDILPDRVRYESNFSIKENKRKKMSNVVFRETDFHFQKLESKLETNPSTKMQTTYKLVFPQ